MNTHTELRIRKIYDVTVFFDAIYLGNTARCYVFPTEPPPDYLISLSKKDTNTCCFIWSTPIAVEVRCYKSGRYIELCGHGLFASMQVWRHLTMMPSDAMPSIRLNTANRVFSAHWRDDKLWIQFPKIECSDFALPKNIAAWFDPAPIGGALAGGEADYRIFIWAPGTNIALVKAETHFLHGDMRATVLTQADFKSPWSFTQRYLVPQYGMSEEGATGSASAVLACYWASKKMVPPFKSLQCALGGGVIDSDVDENSVSLSGTATMMEILAPS
ncbi:MAG: Phenazine biosynthesis PhzC/PhzF protein [Verrucomicrobiaceae bacterium]|nr:Phenazine biosynthesis PhzC/PhzF protein [Verrucomicrobiaceae bacterium]